MDLSSIFKTVSAQLTEQQTALNAADEYNHDHGDNMVKIFDIIQSAVSKKSDKPVDEQLSYASQVVEKEVQSGSAKLLSQGLADAALSFAGTDLQPDTLGLLVKSLLNVKEEQEPKKEQGGVLGSLLSGLIGKKEEAVEEEKKLGVNELLLAGMAYFQAKQDGSSDAEALISALLAASPMGESKHRSMSGSLIANAIMSFAKSGNQ